LGLNWIIPLHIVSSKKKIVENKITSGHPTIAFCGAAGYENAFYGQDGFRED
jgi:hypothetical protein